MKILELHLRAFGPFTDLPLDLSEGNHGFHIIYGANEAGKSSALRALVAWLYGIPHTSTDNFLHDHAQLRIGGRLRHSDGAELGYLRRKGQKKTLLDFDEQPLDDALLGKFLHGVEEELFKSMFGIDHAALIRGGEDILKGGGEIGQSLFSAGLGGASVRKVLDELDSEASSLFALRGQKKVINQLLSEYNETRRLIAEHSISGREWSDREEELKKAVADEEEAAKAVEALLVEKTRLSRLQIIKPKLAKRNELLKRRADLGEVVILPADFALKRQQTVQACEAANENRDGALSALQRLNSENEALVIPEAILDQEKTITALYQRLGSHLKASQDLTGLKARLRQHEVDAEGLLAGLFPNHTLEESKKLRPTAALRTRVQELGSRYQVLINNQERAKKDIQMFGRKLEESTETLARLQAPQDAGNLRRTIDLIRRGGDLEEMHLSSIGMVHAAEDEARIGFGRLGLWTGTLDGLERAPLPSSETCDRFESDLLKLEGEKERLDERIEQVQSEIGQINRQIEEFRLMGAVPTEKALEEARTRRDQGWSLVRRAWINKEEIESEKKAFDPENDLPEAYEKTVRRADELADRLRREAERVAKQAEWMSRQSILGQECAALEETRKRVQLQIQNLKQEWVALWKLVGIVPLSPREMRSWLTKVDEVLQQVEKVRGLRQEAARLQVQIERHRAALNEEIAKVGEKQVASDETLAAGLERGQDIVDSIDRSNRLREDLEKAIMSTRHDLKEARASESDLAGRVAQWKVDWSETVERVGVSGKSSPEEANALLAKLDDLFKKLDEASALEVRIRAIEKDAEAFRIDVQTLLTRIAPDLLTFPADQSAAELHARLTRAKGDAVLRSQLKKQILEKEETLRQSQDTITLMMQRLETLCQQAGCSDPTEMEAIEQRSLEAQNLRKEIDVLEEQLVELSGGASIEALIREAETVDADTLPAEIEKVTRKIQDLEELRSRINQSIGEKRKTLEQMGGSAKAIEPAEKVQGILAEIRSGVERYICLRLAAMILKREIERYRAENQGPLLMRAGEIFSRLTLGRFSRLQTDFGQADEPVLIGIRPNGKQVYVDGMSEGTRDQLYLSLRLASLERYLETNEPMPFIVDDILVNFDNDRAAATLGVLAELSEKTQVIFFTHHLHLVELTQTGGVKEVVRVHQLQAVV